MPVWLSSRVWLGVALALGAALRLWGLATGPPVWHPDEFYLVYTPLNFFSGNLDPGQGMAAFYPGFHYYLLAVCYGLFLMICQVVEGVSFTEVLALYYFWQPDAILLIARLVSVAFGVGTIWWGALLAKQLGGRTAAVAAAMLLAVGVIHVRQSPLAAVDVPMTFWYVGAVWAAVRLLQCERWRDYVLAGALVGLAAASKYPGALAGAATVVAHLVARRSLLDIRIWGAGLVALGCFALASPYTFLHVGDFIARFGDEFAHLQRGRGEQGAGWWYHLVYSLRYNLGWGGLVWVLVALVMLVRQRTQAGWVLVAGLVGYYLFMGSGKLVFVRYALPLMALQAVLVGYAISRVVRARRWQIMLLAATLVPPLYGSLRVAHLQGATDTRTLARTWLEERVPSGTRIANFGGWAGDVQVRNFESLWLHLTHFERYYGRERLESALGFLERELAPHYWYVVHSGIRQHENGAWDLVRGKSTPYVVLHRHALSYSQVDSVFADRLKKLGRRVAFFAPQGLRDSQPQYDDIDAYYIPIGEFEALRQPGPEIEIWHLDSYETPSPQRQTARQVFAAGYAAWALRELADKRVQQAMDYLAFALKLDLKNAEALTVLARANTEQGRLAEAEEIYEQLVFLYPETARFHYQRAQVLFRAGERSIPHFRRALQLQPNHPTTHHNLAVALSRLGEGEAAVAHWQQSIERDPFYASPYRNIGLYYSAAGHYGRAIAFLKKAVQLEPERADFHNELAVAHIGLQQYETAIIHWQKVTELKPEQEQAFYNIAVAYQHGLGRPDEAVAYWEKYLASAEPRADAYVQLITALNSLGRREQAERWTQLFSAKFPDLPQPR